MRPLLDDGWPHRAEPDLPTHDRGVALAIGHRRSTSRLLLLLFLACSCLVSLLGEGRAWAIDIDEAQLTSGDVLPLLRWSNIEGAPHWIGGAPLAYHKPSRRHVAQLTPGQHVTLQLPAGRILRMGAIASNCLSNDINIWASNGSGLYRPLPLGQVEQDGSLLVALDEHADALIRVERTTDDASPLCIAFFLAEPLTPPDGWRYTCPLPCGDRVCQFDAADRAGASNASPYSWLPPSGTTKWTVEGPRRLRLETRLAYLPHEARSRQSYRVQMAMTPGLPGTFDLETTCDRTLSLTEPQPVVGLRRVVYWNVPAGLHRVQLSASDPIWLRATATDILPAMGASSPSCNFPWDQYDSIWDLVPVQAPLQYHVREGLAIQRQRSLLRARDNRVPQGPLDAWQFRSQLARHYPLSVDLMREVDATLTIHSRFRSILPATASGPLELRPGRFVQRRVDLSKEACKSYTISQSHLDDALQGVLSGQFAKLAPGGYLDYWVIGTETSSRIRCIADKSELQDGSELMLQVDQGVAFPIRYLPPQTDLEICRLWSNGDAALSALDYFGGDALPPTLRGPFDARRAAGPWRDVATAEFQLSPGARRLRVTNSSDHDCWLCIQQTESRPYRLSETDWRQSVAHLKDWPAVFRAILRREPLPASCGPDAEELRNHYEPLVSELERRKEAFTRGVTPPADTPVASWSDESISRQLDAARQLSAEKQWLPALRAWTELAHHASGDARREAILERIHTLRASGERYLAEQELKGRFLFDEDEALRDEAFRRLLETYQDQREDRKLRNLVAAAALQRPTRERLLALAEQQVADDEVEDGLSIVLGLDPQERPFDLLCHAALSARWWQTVDEAIGECESSEATHYWRARWLLQQGEVEAAVAMFQNAGESGEQWAAHANRASQIEAALGNQREAVRWQAILDWEAWEVHHPGPRVWQEEDDLMVQCAGTDRIQTRDGATGSDYFVAQPTEPVELLVQGPVHIKLHARPLHGQGTHSTLEDQIIVHGQGKRWLWRINDNAPTDDLRSLVYSQAHVGSLESWEVQLGPGLHRLQVTPDRCTTLFQAFVLRPQVRIPILPRLIPAAVEAAVGDEAPVFQPEAGRVTLVANVTDTPKGVGMPILPLQNQPSSEERQTFMHLESESRARASLRLGNHEPAARTVLLEWIDRQSPDDDLEEQAEILARFAESNDPRWNRFPVEQVSMPWMGAISAQRDWKRLRKIDSGDDSNAIKQLVNSLRYRAEQQPKDQMYVLARIAQLAERFPHQTDLQDVVREMEATGRWLAFREVQESAGVRRVRVTGPITANQSARVRFALMSPSSEEPFDATHLLANSSPATIAVERPKPTDVAIVIRPMRGSFEPPSTQSWQLLLDGQVHQTIVCGEKEVEISASLTVPAGSHTLVIQVPEGTAESQYAAAIVAQLASNGDLKALPELEREEAGQRLVYVATPTQPIRFQPRGPALFRVEQLTLDGTMIASHKMAVTDSVVADVELTAEPEQNQAYFRILEHQSTPVEKRSMPSAKTSDDDQLSSPEELPLPHDSQPIPMTFAPSPVDDIIQSPSTPDVVAVSYEESAGGPLSTIAALRSLPPDAPVTLVSSTDAIPLGNHEDGTWGWTVGATTRRPVDEGRNQGAPDQFLQLGGNYQEYNELLDRYTRTQGVARMRDESGPSFGLIHERWSPVRGMGERTDAFDSLPPWAQCLADQLRLDQEWYAYLQQPSDALPGKDESLEASLGTRQRLYVRHEVCHNVYHVPSVMWFGRWLSMDEVSYSRGRVDQDIFTQYKADHRMGLQLSDLWVYEPESVVRWYLRPAVTTNEDHNPFDPDHVSVQTGLSTLLDDLYLGVSYRCTAFLADADRANSSTQHLISLDATLDHWQHAGRRCELDVALRHVIDQNETSAMLNLTLFRSQGRGYRDHAPGEVDFRRERERRAFGTWQRGERALDFGLGAG